MTISVIGIGRIGLGIALNFENLGHNVIGYDINQKHVNSINDKSYDSSESLYNKYLKNSTNLKATTNIEEALTSDIIFIMVRTDSYESGEYNCSQIESVYSKLIKFPQQSKTLVLCSNINPGYCDKLAQRLLPYGYYLSFNPEWVAQGDIMKNLRNPDLIVIGEASEEEGNKIEKLYKSFTKSPIHRMNRISAELTKIGLNCFLTTKISYANSLGDLAIKMGGDPSLILKAIGGDSRIGTKYFSYGHSYGGPCFPRDNRALIYTANQFDEKSLLQKAVDESNNDHLKFMVNHFAENNNIEDPIITEEVTYKPGVPYIEESKQLEYIVGLAKKGFYVTIKETSQVIKQIKDIYGDMFKYIIK